MIKNIPAYFLIFILISGTISSISPISSNAFAEEERIFPDWIRTVFTFWANGSISDQDLKGALEFLFEKKILSLEKKQTKSPTAVSPQVVKTSSILHDSQKSNITINDGDFFTVAQSALTGWVKEIQNNPTANLLVKSALPVIPVIGPLLANLYDNAEGTPEAKNAIILEVLEKYQNLNKDQLTLAFAKLDDNKEAIEKNTYKLTKLQADTKEILVIVKEIDITTKDSNKKIDQLLALVNDIKREGKKLVATPEQIQAANTVTQIYSTSSNLGATELETLATSYLISGQLKSAIIIYDKILAQNPSNYNALIEKAWALYDLERLSEANTAFETHLKYYPQDSDGWEGKGWSLLDLGSLDDAKDSFNESFRLDDSNSYAVAGLGWVSLEEGDCQTAESIFYDVLIMDEENVVAIIALDEISNYGC